MSRTKAAAPSFLTTLVTFASTASIEDVDRAQEVLTALIAGRKHITAVKPVSMPAMAVSAAVAVAAPVPPRATAMPKGEAAPLGVKARRGRPRKVAGAAAMATPVNSNEADVPLPGIDPVAGSSLTAPANTTTKPLPDPGGPLGEE